MEALQTLKELITTPIINPMPAKSGEAAQPVAIDYLDSLLSREQIDCERQTAVPLIAVVHATGGRSDSGGLLLNSRSVLSTGVCQKGRQHRCVARLKIAFTASTKPPD